MTPSNGLCSGLNHLVSWLSDSPEASSLDLLLPGWVRASGWKSAGLVWPVEGPPKVGLLAKPEGTEPLSVVPVELGDMVKSLTTGNPTVVWQVPGTAGRLYTLLTPPGRPVGVVWAERSVTEPWTDADRSYLRLSAKLIERSPALSAKIGPIVDAERLQQRLTDASIIAGRMAHDFDNILTGIIGFADLSAPLLPAGSQPARYVGEISKVGQRGITFTQQLHQLSRSGQAKPLPGSVAAAVAKEELRLRPMMPSGLQFQAQLPNNLAAVAMDAGPLQTVLGHLIENGVQASPANGRITVTARPVELTAVDARGYLGQVSPGAHLELTITDTGNGIKPEVRARLFVEPFYTTKVRHRGLGLAIVYRVLFAHRGGIRIDAAPSPETGTVVRVVIPLATARQAVVPTAVAAPAYGG